MRYILGFIFFIGKTLFGQDEGSITYLDNLKVYNDTINLGNNFSLDTILQARSLDSNRVIITKVEHLFPFSNQKDDQGNKQNEWFELKTKCIHEWRLQNWLLMGKYKDNHKIGLWKVFHRPAQKGDSIPFYFWGYIQYDSLSPNSFCVYIFEHQKLRWRLEIQKEEERKCWKYHKARKREVSVKKIPKNLYEDFVFVLKFV